MDKEEFEKTVKEAEEKAPPMFHPVRKRHDGAWFPSNEAGSIASILSHTWEDMQCLFKIRRKRKSDYEKKLLFKYIIIELRSVIEQLEKMQSIIFAITKGGSKGKTPSVHILETEAEELNVLFKKYHSTKKSIEKDIIDIRNNIGAHRGNQPWKNIMELWDKLEPKTFEPFFIIIPELFELIIKLDIYDWTRIPEEGAIEICCSSLNRP